MFLNMLNQKERVNFLELAHVSMHANGIVHESEEKVFETFRREVGMFTYTPKAIEYDKLVSAFQSSTKKVRKVVLIEIAGILDSDGEIDAVEKKWVEQLGLDLSFRDTEIKKMVRWVEDFNDLLQEGYDYINKR